VPPISRQKTLLFGTPLVRQCLGQRGAATAIPPPTIALERTPEI